jgi:hypothetical protein
LLHFGESIIATMQATKKCSICELVLPLKEFHRDAQNKDGLQGYCKECNKSLRRRRQQKNKEKHANGFTVAIKEKKCNVCKQILPISEFSRNITTKDGFRYSCKKCDSDRDSAWKKNNPDKNRALKAKRRAKKKQALAPWASPSELQKHYAHAQWLNKTLPNHKFQVDHIFPLQSDFLCGLHVETNLMVLEASQNASKNNRQWPGQLPCQQGIGNDHQWWKELKGMQ